MELDYKAIGKRIKIARIKADLTQERLAEKIELSPRDCLPINMHIKITKMSFLSMRATYLLI